MSLRQTSIGFMRLPYTIFVLVLGRIINIAFVCVSQRNVAIIILIASFASACTAQIFIYYLHETNSPPGGSVFHPGSD